MAMGQDGGHGAPERHPEQRPGGAEQQESSLAWVTDSRGWDTRQQPCLGQGPKKDETRSRGPEAKS